MGVGFLITIVFLGALLGLFARQALATADEPVEESQGDSSTPTHPHAM